MMQLAISNIAWDVAEDEAVASLLSQFGVESIDIAPGKYFKNPALTTDQDISSVKEWWAQRNIQITGMQALLFGTTGLNVFGSPSSRADLVTHISHVCRIAAGLGVKNLVFGSPKNRDRSGLLDDEVNPIAIEVFREIGDIAALHRVAVCLEPNPSCYGANFMTSSLETAEVVVAVAHPHVRMQLDIGALTINNESAEQILKQCAPLIGHVHISEPNLLPIGDASTNHEQISMYVHKYLTDPMTLTIEMLATDQEAHIQSVERSIRTATNYYFVPKKGVH